MISATRSQTAGVTPKEINALLAAAEAPDLATAAALVGLTESNIANVLHEMRRKLGVKTNLQAYHLLVGGVRSITSTTVRLEKLDEK